MNNICNTSLCTGCAACQNICSHDAIKMEVAFDGFLRPQINHEKCVNCGICASICPVNIPIQKSEPLAACMAWTNEKKLREYSSSGGVFPAVAISVIQQCGVVFGAGYDSEMNVRHISIENVNQLPILQGSKYVQSATDNVFRAVKQYLQTGRIVYFVGTPCQVAGLKAFLRKDYANLLTSDFVCHGCPSNDAFQKQLKTLERKYDKQISDFKFRSKKRFGQGCDCLIVTDDGRKKYLNIDLIPYFYGFWKNISLRDSCYQCQYATTQRVSDITLGDYWSIKRRQYGESGGRSKGVSLCLINTQLGRKFMIESQLLRMKDVLIHDAVKVQGHLSHPVKMPHSHVSFIEDYSQLHWEELCLKYFSPGINYRLKKRFRNFFKLVLFYKLWK